MSRITLTIPETERQALVKLAELEFRDPRVQAVLIIISELVKRGLLTYASRSRAQSKAIDLQEVQNDK